MGRRTALIAAVAALALWLGFCLFAHPPKIEAALRSEASQALVAAGLTGVRADFDGRDAVLAGTVASPDLATRAQRLVAGVEGVLTVTDRLQVVEAPEPEPEPLPTYLEIRARPSGVTLRGPVESETLRRELVARARELYGEERVEALLEVDAARAGAAQASAAQVLGVLARSGQTVEARLEGDSLRLSGTVDSPEARRQIEARARAAAPRIRLFFSTVTVTPEGDPAAGEPEPGKD